MAQSTQSTLCTEGQKQHWWAKWGVAISESQVIRAVTPEGRRSDHCLTSIFFIREAIEIHNGQPPSYESSVYCHVRVRFGFGASPQLSNDMVADRQRFCIYISLVLSSQTFLVALSRNNPLLSCSTYTGYLFFHQSHDLFEVLAQKRNISIWASSVLHRMCHGGIMHSPALRPIPNH